MAFYCCLMFTRKTQLHACIEFRLFGKNKMNVNLLEVEFENQNFYFFIVAERQLSQYIFFHQLK